MRMGEHRRFRFAFFFPSLLGQQKSPSKGRKASGSAVDGLSWLGPTKNKSKAAMLAALQIENAPFRAKDSWCASFLWGAEDRLVA
jgi:hypothetical protein